MCKIQMVLVLIFMLTNVHNIMAMDSVYISESSGPHYIKFLIVQKDSIIIEEYFLRFKFYNPISRKVERDLITGIKDTVILTEHHCIRIVDSKLLLDKDIFTYESFIGKLGDFNMLDTSFDTIINSKKLNVCRNAFFLFNPPKKYRKKCQRYRERILSNVDLKISPTEFVDKIEKLILE